MTATYYRTRLRAKGQVTIPAEAREFLNLNEGDEQIKPNRGGSGIYKVRIGESYRMIYEGLPGNVVRIRIVGKHDKALGHP